MSAETPTWVATTPSLGGGLGYRPELHDETMRATGRIDFLEVIADRYLDPDGPRRLGQLVDVYPVIPHGVGLSVGTAQPMEPAYLAGMKRVSDACESPFYSDHLCMTMAGGIDLGHLAPLVFDAPVFEVVRTKVEQIQERLGKPLVLENVTHMVDIPQNPDAEADFFSELTAETGCGMLLDLTNLFTNCSNFSGDPLRTLDRLPLSSVVQVHLAGGYWEEEFLFDSHNSPVPEEVWTLLDELTARVRLPAVSLEHDHDFPDFELLAGQVERARAALRRADDVAATHAAR